MRPTLKHAIIALVFLGLGAALSDLYNDRSLGAPAWTLAQGPSPEPLPLASRSTGFFDFADLVEQSESSVAQVRVEKDAAAEPDPDPFEKGPLWEYFRKFAPPGDQLPYPGAPFRGPAPGGEKEGGEEEPDDGKSSGLGSGFFIDDQGHLLTNAHVVEGADRVTLRLKDRREIQARVIGADKRTDIALLKAEGPGPFKPLKIGDPERARVGEWVLAIGSPFGFESTATVGVLSAKERSLPHDDNYLPFLQTDAAVNPGNSGGPLLSQRGEVIGINTQIYSRSGGYMGLSFSLPIDYAMRIAAKLKKDGSVNHGRIGATIQEMTPELAAALGVKDGAGAVVIATEPGSPAAKAGLQPGDALVSVNGKRVQSSAAFVRVIADSDPGSKVIIGLTRKGRLIEVPMIVASAESAGRVAVKLSEAEAQSPEQALGLLFGPAEKGQPGLLIIDSRGRALRAGFRKGDILVMADGEKLTSPAQLLQIASRGDPQIPIAALIKRGKDSLFVALPRKG